jgi:hypothetical protein
MPLFDRIFHKMEKPILVWNGLIMNKVFFNGIPGPTMWAGKTDHFETRCLLLYYFTSNIMDHKN